MVRQLKPIGTYSERKARKYLKLGLLFLIPFALLWLCSIRSLPLYIDVGRYENQRGFLMGALATLGMAFIILRYSPWKSGLTGERNVVRNISDKLSSEYSILNDVWLKDGKRGNVDHIIVGPTGIFAIETKNNEGTITYDGNWKGIKGSPSGQAKRNAVRINDILKSYEVLKEKDLYVKAVVAFTNSKVKLDLSTEPAKCRVVQIKNQADSSLSDYIEGERLRFSEKDIMLIEQSLIEKTDFNK